MTIYFTSDQHFNHKNIIKYCDRPFEDVTEMNDQIILRWNLKVMPTDTVYVIGDFSFGNKEQTQLIYNRLLGNKILIRGNHDNNNTCNLFDEVHHDLTIKIGDYDVLLCHYPYQHRDDDVTNYLVANGHFSTTPDKGLWLLHGHVHTMWQIMEPKRMINVGVDVWDFSPISEEYIRDIITRS